MAIIKGAINFGSNFNIGAKGPIDARQRVETIADLTTVWTAEIPAYKGMVVSVLEDNSIYILKSDDATVFDNWKKVGDVTGDITNLQGQTTANKAAIDKINGDASTTGSFAKGDADTLAAAKADATTKADAVKGSDTDDAGAATVYGANKAAAAAQKTINDFKDRTEGFATAAQGTKADAADTLSKANKAAIGVINGDGDGSIKKAVSDAKTELIGDDATVDTIKHAEKLATDASAKVDTEIGKLDVAGNVSEAVKGVTVTVDETDGKVIQPVVSIADGTLTGAATDENLVTGKAVKNYVDGEITKVNTAAGTLSGRVDTLEDKVGSKAVEGGAAATGLFKDVADNKAAIAAEKSRATEAETALSDRVTTLEGTKHVDSLGGKTGAITVDGVGAGSYPVKLAMTNQKLGATISGLGTAAAKAVGDFDAAGAADSIKTALVDNATDEYNTLGKLETKIKAEASTARDAEKKNADAAAAAKTAADTAQRTADAKVASVTAKDGETAIEVDNTTATAPKISLKLDNDGNVQFVQTAKGLKGSVEIPEATVTGVKADDKFLSLADKLVSADVSIAYDADDKKIYLYGKDKTKANAVSSIDCTDFIKDGMLNSAELVTNPAGQSAGTYIKLTWNTDGGKDPMYINVTSLIDIYTAKPDGGLVLEGHAFSVDTTKIATVESVNGVTSRVSTLEGKVGSAAVEGGAAATGLYKEIADKINSLDGGGTSQAVKGVTVTVNETDGIIATPSISIAAGTVGGASDANLVTGDTVKTYVDTAITNAALVWHDIA